VIGPARPPTRRPRRYRRGAGEPAAAALIVAWLALLAACNAGGAAGPAVAPPPQPTPSPAADPELLLPDLVTTRPDQLYIEEPQGGGGRELRFSTTLVNRGIGPLSLLGSFDEASGDASAIQVIKRRDGGEVERFAGKLSLDPAHGHYHLNDFFIFELWTYGPRGSLDRLVATTGKITFCLLDVTRAEPAPTSVAEAPEFIECSWRQQGISQGWSETYDATLPGQQLDLTGVPDGRYAVRARIDPDGLLAETNKRNNSLIFYVEITGTEVRLLDRP